jgi:hypothetical protein
LELRIRDPRHGCPALAASIIGRHAVQRQRYSSPHENMKKFTIEYKCARCALLNILIVNHCPLKNLCFILFLPNVWKQDINISEFRYSQAGIGGKVSLFSSDHLSNRVLRFA